MKKWSSFLAHTVGISTIEYLWAIGIICGFIASKNDGGGAT